MLKRELVDRVMAVFGFCTADRVKQCRQVVALVESESPLGSSARLLRMLAALRYAADRISYHSAGCRGGDFATCRCSNAVTVRTLDREIARAEGRPLVSKTRETLRGAVRSELGASE